MEPEYVKIGKVFIGGEEIGEARNITFTPDEPYNKGWVLDTTNLESFSFTCKNVWKSKIDKALGFTHYVKNGRLYRK